MNDKRIEDVPEIPEDKPEAGNSGIDIPVSEEAPARGRSRRGIKRAEPSEADSGLLPESGAPAETVYTLGPQNEFGEVENVSFEQASEEADKPSAPKKGASLDISDIPNAVASHNTPALGNFLRRRKRRTAKPHSTAAASEKTSIPASAPSGVPSEPTAPAAKPASVPEAKTSPAKGTSETVETPSGATEASADAEVSAEAADAAPKAAQTESAAGDAVETEDAPSETSERPPRAPKPKAPAATLLLRGILSENPLLFGLVGVFPAVAAASTGITALAAGICVLAALIATNLAASLIGDRLPRRLRAALLLLLAACVSSGEQLALEALLPETADALGIFVPLVAVCGLTLAREGFASEHHPVSALIDAAACGVGFAAALTLFGVIREVLGSKALFGFDISVPGLPPVLAFTAPVGGLLLLGLLSGAAKYVRTKRRASKRGSKEAEL